MLQWRADLPTSLPDVVTGVATVLFFFHREQIIGKLLVLFHRGVSLLASRILELLIHFDKLQVLAKSSRGTKGAEMENAQTDRLTVGDFLILRGWLKRNQNENAIPVMFQLATRYHILLWNNTAPQELHHELLKPIMHARGSKFSASRDMIKTSYTGRYLSYSNLEIWLWKDQILQPVYKWRNHLDSSIWLNHFTTNSFTSIKEQRTYEVTAGLQLILNTF